MSYSPEHAYAFEWNSVPIREWDRLVAGFSDGNVYQTATYAHVRMHGLFYDRVILKRQGRIAGLCVVRTYRVPFLPIGIAKVTFGPLWKKKTQTPDPADLQELIRVLKDRVCKKSGLALVISPAIYDGDDQSETIAKIFRGEGFFDAHDEGFTPVMHLDFSVEVLRANLEQKWRNRLNAAERQGLRVTLSTSVPDFDSFCEVYFRMRHRRQYHSSENVRQFREVFAKTEELLRSRVALCWKDERPVAGAIIGWLGDTALYIFGGGTNEALKLQAANLLQWNIVKWAKGSGFAYYDLMSVSDAAPWFKRGLRGKSGTDMRRMGPFVAAPLPWNRVLVRGLKQSPAIGNGKIS